MERSALHLVDGDDLAPFVEAAARADPVWKLGLMALRAEAQSGRLQVVVRATRVAAGLRVAALGIRHQDS
jgi:hypothetical protein